MDLFSTIVDVCGARMPDDRIIDGHNSILMLKGEGDSGTDIFFYHNGRNLQAVRKGEWKLRITAESGIELYNLLLDQSEKYNRAEEFPELVEELHNEMKQFSKETGAVLIGISNNALPDVPRSD
jgi:arylsulfatase A-like enzyme